MLYGAQEIVFLVMEARESFQFSCFLSLNFHLFILFYLILKLLLLLVTFLSSVADGVCGK